MQTSFLPRDMRPPAPGTAQQRLIVEILRDATDHPTAAEIYRRARRRRRGIGRATVYRTLSRCVEDGTIVLLRGNGREARYDGIVEPHDHLQCSVCDRIVDVTIRRPATFGRSAAARHAFRLTAHRVELVGICQSCRTQHR